MISDCAAVFLVLLLTSMVMQFLRAKKRERLVRSVDPDVLPPHDKIKWMAVGGSFGFLFKDFRRLQILKRNVAVLSNENKSSLSRYSFFSKAEIAVTITMLLFGVFAYLLCS